MAACALTARPTSQANPAVHYDWWLGLRVCSRPGFGCSVGPRWRCRDRIGPRWRNRAPIGPRSGMIGPMAACALTPKATSYAKPAVHYDWWLGLVVCRGRSVGPRSGPDGFKAASKAKPAARCDWWLRLVVCSPPRSASIAASGPDCASVTRALEPLWNSEPGGNLVEPLLWTVELCGTLPQGCPMALAASRNPWNPKPAK